MRIAGLLGDLRSETYDAPMLDGGDNLTAESRLRSGDTLDRYLILRRLDGNAPGRGRTYLAFDTEGVEIVVIQVAEASFEDLGTFVQNFSLARDHADVGLPLVLSGGSEDGWAYIVSEWVTGPSVAELIASGPTDRELVAALLWAASDSLAGLHGRRRIHGDIHPHNLRITRRGNLKLVGHMPAPLGNPLYKTADSDSVARWVAPEGWVAKSLRSSEVYSLGLVTFAMLTGTSLLPTGSRQEVYKKQFELNQSFQEPGRLHARVPPALDDLLRRMLAFAASDRIANGIQLVEALLSAWPAVARRDELPELLQGELPRARQVASEKLLASVDSCVKRGATLEAATALRQMAALKVPWKSPSNRRAKVLLREIVWLELETPSPQQPVLMYLLWRAAMAMGAKIEAKLLGVILCRITPPESPLRGALPENLNASPSAAERRIFSTHLRDEPFSPRALLGLAVHAESQWPAGYSRLRWQASLLESVGQPSQALALLAKDLANHTGAETDLLPELEGLTQSLKEGTAFLGSIEDFLSEETSLEELSENSADWLNSGVSVTSEISHASQPLGTALANAAEVFTKAIEQAKEGRIEAAADSFAHLLDAGEHEREHYLPLVCDEVRGLLWRVLTRTEEGASSYSMIRRITELVRETGLVPLEPLAESMLIAHLPEAQEERRDALKLALDAAPRSVRLRQAIAVECLEEGDHEAWARHLLVAGELLLEKNDLLFAGKVLMAAREVLSVGEMAPAIRSMFTFAEEVAGVSDAFQDLKIKMVGQPVSNKLEQCGNFLKEHPSFRPAQELEVELAEAASAEGRVSRGALELGRSSLLREDFKEARQMFRFVLESEPENDEALLFLASLNLPEVKPGEHPLQTKLNILIREELPQVAMHRVRRALRKKGLSAAIQLSLFEYCISLGQDLEPYLMALLAEATRTHDSGLARQVVQRAIEATDDHAFLVSIFLNHPEFEVLLSKQEVSEMVLQARQMRSPSVGA